MTSVTLGSTGITVNKNAFGALPVQRVSKQEAAYLLRKAFKAGITYFDTARAYSDSEEKLALGLSDVREQVYIATKTMATTADAVREQLEASLAALKTDYIDVYQLHNPSFVPRPGDGSGIYEVLLEAKEQGKIRHIGITNHRLPVAEEAVLSGLYEVLQFPFSYLADEKDIALVNLCAEKNVGFVAMKSLSGGLITNSAAAYAFADRFPGVLPIWGIQRESELDEFISYISKPPVMTDTLQAVIDSDRKDLCGEFCRGCGYCMPCPAGIEISNSARMSKLIRRAPSEAFLNDTWRELMGRIENCTHCESCKSKCPYGLDTPELLARNYQDYKEILAGKPL